MPKKPFSLLGTRSASNRDSHPGRLSTTLVPKEAQGGGLSAISTYPTLTLVLHPTSLI